MTSTEKEETARKAVQGVSQQYRDFGPTMAAEYLDKDLQIGLSARRYVS